MGHRADHLADRPGRSSVVILVALAIAFGMINRTTKECENRSAEIAKNITSIILHVAKGFGSRSGGVKQSSINQEKKSSNDLGGGLAYNMRSYASAICLLFRIGSMTGSKSTQTSQWRVRVCLSRTVCRPEGVIRL